jgi:uncharacterized protein YjbI with pentapeptide repeats
MKPRNRYGCIGNPVTIAIIITLAAIVFISVGYRNNWSWTGFLTKTLWDWMQLLIIPFVLAIGGLLYNNARDKTDREVASDKQREDALHAYIDDMSELLLGKNLRDSQPEDEVRKIVRVRTLTILRRLDAKRRVDVLHFLQEAGLIDKDKPIISLKEADLSEVFLSSVTDGQANFRGINLSGAMLAGASIMFANLTGADLSGTVFFEAHVSSTKLIETNLSEANLHKAHLYSSDFSRANLTGADLESAILTFANLSEADLSGADLTKAEIRFADLNGAELRRANLNDTTGITVETLEKQAKSLKGATMPDGSVHP